MKKKSRLIYGLIYLILFPPMVFSEIIIDKTIKAKIVDILAQPIKSYTLDLDQNRIVFKHIDDWINNRVNWSDKNIRSLNKKGVQIRRIEVKKNKPILPSAKMPKGIKSIKSSFGIVSYQAEDKRCYFKELSVPTTSMLSKEKLKKIAHTFIDRNNFSLQTEDDKIGKARFFSIQRQKINRTGIRAERLILSHEVVLKREIDGIEVVNSKQIVGIHPDSEEILSYRSLRWTPVDPNSGKIPSYLRIEEVIDKIKKAYEKSPYVFEIKDVKLGLYQAKEIIFPAMIISAKPRVKEGEPLPLSKTLIVSLAKDLDIDYGESTPKIKPDKRKIMDKIKQEK